MEKIMGAFGARVKTLRKERNMRQVDMAALLECTDRHYQRMEYGDINIPSLTIIKLADYFNVSTDYLLGRSDIR